MCLPEGSFCPPFNVDGDLSQEMLDHCSGIRRPGYFLRGAPVSPELAREIIARTAFVMKHWFEDLCDSCYWNWANTSPTSQYFDRLSTWTPFLDFVHFNNWWFEGHDPIGWCHFDGTLGADAITQKYPEVREYILDWAPFAAAFPQVELMVLTLRLDEGVLDLHGTRHPRYITPYDAAEVKKYADVGFHIHDGRMTLLQPQDAHRLFLDFQARYPYDEEEQRRREILPDKEEFLAWAKDFLRHVPFFPPLEKDIIEDG